MVNIIKCFLKIEKDRYNIIFIFVEISLTCRLILLGPNELSNLDESQIDTWISMYMYQGSKLRGAEGQNAPKLSPNAPRLLNLGAKFCYPIQPDICFEAQEIAPVTVTFAPWFQK